MTSAQIFATAFVWGLAAGLGLSNALDALFGPKGPGGRRRKR